MYSIFNMDFLLFGEESIFDGIAHLQQAGEFILIGRSYYLLDFLHFVGNRNVEHSSQSFIRCCKEHILHGTPG